MISRSPTSYIALGLTALGLSAAPGSGCVQVTPGIQLSLNLEVAAPDDISPEGHSIYISPVGAEVHIASGYLNIAAWEVLPCKAARSPWPKLASVAYAHTQNTPTLWGIPQAISLAPQGRDPVNLGTITPPPGPWCSLLLHLSPADGDGLGLPASGEMTGQTLTLSGAYGLADTGERDPLDIQSSTSNLIVLAFGDDGLIFDEAAPWGEATLRIDPGQLFNNLEGWESTEALQALAEQNLTSLATLSELEQFSSDYKRPDAPAP